MNFYDSELESCMNQKKVIEPLFNPALGMLPLVLCVIVDYFVSYRVAFLSGVILFAFWMILSRLFFRYSPPYMLIVIGFVFFIYAVCSFFDPFRTLYVDYSLIICEIFLVFAFSFFNLFKKPIKERCNRLGVDKATRCLRKAKLDEFFYIARLYKNVLITHLFIVLTYSLLPPEYRSPGKDLVVYTLLFILFVILVIVYEYVRLSMLNKQIDAEEWLPIVNETGGVTGRIAFSVSQTSKDHLLHPVIRIALIYNGMLYLKERSPRYVSDPNKIDYPFEKYVFYKQTLEETVKDSLLKGSGVSDLPVRFIFRYLFKNMTVNRLVYLYTCIIHDEETLKKLNLGNGKLWTDKQIEENLNRGIFSECFEKEYEILKNTILMADRRIRETEILESSGT